jgi:hypothetical protein
VRVFVRRPLHEVTDLDDGGEAGEEQVEDRGGAEEGEAHAVPEGPEELAPPARDPVVQHERVAAARPVCRSVERERGGEGEGGREGERERGRD